MKSCIGKILICYCFFVFLFPFKVFGLDPRWLVFVIYFIINPKVKYNILHVNNRVIRVIRYPLLMAILSVIGIIINGSIDLTFIYFPIQVIYLLLLSYCIYRITKYYINEADYYIITKYYIICLIIQSFIAIIMFINEPVRDFFFRLQGFELTERVIQMFLGVRLLGLGCFYFGAGVLYGLGLILLVPVMFRSTNHNTLFKLILLYLYLFAIGCFFARTCMIGFAVSAFIVASSFTKTKLRNRAFTIIRQFLTWTCLITLSLISIYLSSPKLQEDYGKIIDFGFEAFINLSENGELSTKSSDGLQNEHLKVLPDNLKTYFIGDTKWMDGEQYYKGSDVGYIRLLFFGGFTIIILFILYQYSVLSTLCCIYGNPVIKRCFIFTLFYIIMLLIKGYTDVASLMFIYLFYNENTLLYRRAQPRRC